MTGKNARNRRYIALEGGDGSGKTTLSAALAERLGLNGDEVVEVRPGVLTKIIEVSTNDEVLRFRCFGAKATAEAVRRAVDQARGSSPA